MNCNDKPLSKDVKESLMACDDMSRRNFAKRLLGIGALSSLAVSVVPDAAKLGYSVIALVALQVDLRSIDTVAQELSAHPNVHYIAECTGAHDMFIGVWLEKTQQLAQFIKEFIAKLPGIRSSETFMILNVYKNDAGWLQSSEQ